PRYHPSPRPGQPSTGIDGGRDGWAPQTPLREGLRMGSEEAVRLRAVLDRMVKEKEIAAAFFGRMAESLEEVEHRRWFRRMAQDEKDQRKILVKHRRELCGSVTATAPLVLSALHE